MYGAMTPSTKLPTGVTEVVYMNNMLSSVVHRTNQGVMYVNLWFQFLLAQAISLLDLAAFKNLILACLQSLFGVAIRVTMWFSKLVNFK